MLVIFVFSVFDLRIGFVVSLGFGFRLSSFAFVFDVYWCFRYFGSIILWGA